MMAKLLANGIVFTLSLIQIDPLSVYDLAHRYWNKHHGTGFTEDIANDVMANEKENRFDNILGIIRDELDNLDACDSYSSHQVIRGHDHRVVINVTARPLLNNTEEK